MSVRQQSERQLLPTRPRLITAAPLAFVYLHVAPCSHASKSECVHGKCVYLQLRSVAHDSSRASIVAMRLWTEGISRRRRWTA